jgi:hypothetical protein
MFAATEKVRHTLKSYTPLKSSMQITDAADFASIVRP